MRCYYLLGREREREREMEGGRESVRNGRMEGEREMLPKLEASQERAVKTQTCCTSNKYFHFLITFFFLPSLSHLY